MAEAKPTVVVFSASSNTGEAAISHLLESGKVNVRAVVRSLSQKSEAFEGKVEYIKADITQKRILGPVFEGVNSAYFATPATQDRAKLVSYFVDACFDHGVENAVIISVLGAETKTTRFQKQFAEIEEYALSKAGRPVKVGIADRGHKKFTPTIIRAAPFYQNMYGLLGTLVKGTFYYPLGNPAGNLCHVSYDDVALAIATVLEQPGAHGEKVYNIIGEHQTGNQISSCFSMKASMHCTYEHVPDEIAVEAFVAIGVQSWIAEGNIELVKFSREGGNDKYGPGDLQALTGNAPMKFGTFVKEFIKPLINSV